MLERLIDQISGTLINFIWCAFTLCLFITILNIVTLC